MKFSHSKSAMVFGFAWRCGVITTAVALLAARAPGERVGGLRARIAPGPVDLATTIHGGSVELMMKPEAGQLTSSCTMVDEDGNQLLQTIYHRGACLWVGLGDAFPVRPSFTAIPAGEFEAAAHDGRHRYRMILLPGRTSSVRTSDIWWKDRHGLGYTREGELVVDPSDVGEVANGGPGSSGSRAAAVAPDGSSDREGAR